MRGTIITNGPRHLFLGGASCMPVRSIVFSEFIEPLLQIEDFELLPSQLEV